MKATWALVLILVAALAASTAQAEEVVASRDSTRAIDPATPGIITGYVYDGRSGDPLEYTNIIFHRRGERGEPVQAGGTISLSKGYFVQRLAPGDYDVTFLYIGYKRHVVERLHVRPGVTHEIGVRLDIEPVEMPRFTVQGTVIRNTEVAALSRQQKSAVVSDAITSEQIGRGTDSDAAEALERVTGVSVVDGKYVFVRGLGDRYSSTQLNGASLGSPEPNKRTIPLDIFPASLLDNMEIQKTWSPDLEAEFGGGSINVNTRSTVERRTFAQKISLGVATNALDMGRLDYAGGSLDFLGFDDGTRALPDAIASVDPDKHIEMGDFTLEELRGLRKSFKNVWSPQEQDARPNFSYGGVFADRFTLFGRPGGFISSLSLNNGVSSRQKKEITYQGSENPTPRTDYDVLESTTSTLGGLLGALSLAITETDRLKLDLLYTRSADDKARLSEGPNDDRGTELFRQLQLSYVERGLFSSVLKGSHRLPLSSRLEWTASRSQATRNEPDRRLAVYEQDLGSGEIRLSRGFLHPLTRIFGASDEQDRSLRVDWTLPMPWGQEGANALKLGASWRRRDRSSEYRRFGIRCRSRDCGDLTLSPEEILSDENPASEFYIVEELTRANDSYDAHHDVDGRYAMLDLRPARYLRLSGGVRIEESRQAVTAESPFATADTPPEEAHLDRRNLLPAVNVTWRMTERMNLRLSWSETLNRPELRELSPFSMYNYETNANERGNPELDQALLTGYDLRWELYPTPRQYAALGFFYKDLEHPIERIVQPDVGGYAEFPSNADTGLLRGVELELRTTLEDLWRGLLWPFGGGPRASFLSHLAFSVNHTRVHSEVSIPVAGAVLSTPLTGQSTQSTNLGLFLASHRWDASLLYKSFGKRLASSGLGVLPDVYEHPLESLDAALVLKMGSGVQMKLAAENLLDDDVEFRQGDLPTRAWSPGRKVALSVSYSR